MRFIIFLAGAAMAASYFVTWIEPPFAGAEISPAANIGDGLSQLIQDGPWQAWVFLGGFALAGLAALLALLGRASGLLAILAGLSPVVLIVDLVMRAEDLRTDLGLPFEIDTSNLAQAWDVASDFVRAGLWMYAVGAGLLLLAGLSVSFSRR